MQAAAADPVFEAILYPNQSLQRRGYFILMTAFCLVSALVGGFFLFLGAWPVTGYFGLDVLALYAAFRAVRRQSRRRELIRLDAHGLHVRRVAADGREQDWRFEPYWARVQVDAPGSRTSRLSLISHGRRLTLGTFLTPEERLEVARALDDALRRYHEPAPLPAAP